MTQADSVHSTPRTNSPLKNLALQEARRVRAIKKISILRRQARDQIVRLIDFLDQSDEYVMTELEDDADREQECEDEGAISDDEPALGGLDHHHSQERWATGDRRDLELDGAESGIGDIHGLLEQIGPQDWQAGNGGMV